MNREIKFRGKRVDNGEWVYGGFYCWKDKAFIIQKDIWDTSLNTASMVEVKPETVGEYIGMNDIHNKEIYEDDALKVTMEETFEEKKYTGIVTIDPICTYLDFPNRGTMIALNEFNIEFREIAGNIHDNPEQINKGE